ncbi:MAG: hypothetical protein KC502_11295 [Myxococcales bacterium]|nr:hypothetical protein [Myxococcales bacterium]
MNGMQTGCSFPALLFVGLVATAVGCSPQSTTDLGVSDATDITGGNDQTDSKRTLDGSQQDDAQAAPSDVPDFQTTDPLTPDSADKQDTSNPTTDSLADDGQTTAETDGAAADVVVDGGIPNICAGAADGTPCPDGDICNGAETCQSGGCQAGSPLVCDDNNLCTKNVCSTPKGCTALPMPDGLAATYNACTKGKVTCKNGSMSSGAMASLDDGDPCTMDYCVVVNGQHTAMHKTMALLPCSGVSGCSKQTVCDSAGACICPP